MDLYYIIDNETGEFIKSFPGMPIQLLLAINFKLTKTEDIDKAAIFSEEEIDEFALLNSFPFETKLQE